MKKINLFSILAIFGICNSATAFTPWWEQPTVCRLDPTRCYTAMGAGFDTELWDNDAECWGQKIICAAALKNGTENTPLTKNQTYNSRYIRSDFDTDLLSIDGDCFGRRTTFDNDSMALVDGNRVPIWCPGILDNADEVLSNGEIVYGAQPTCTELAEYGYVWVKNGKCYGKFFNQNEYYIDCMGQTQEPKQLIIINGADIGTHGGTVTAAEIEKKFRTMYDTSRAKKAEKFKNTID